MVGIDGRRLTRNRKCGFVAQMFVAYTSALFSVIPLVLPNSVIWAVYRTLVVTVASMSSLHFEKEIASIFLAVVYVCNPFSKNLYL